MWSLYPANLFSSHYKICHTFYFHSADSILWIFLLLLLRLGFINKIYIFLIHGYSLVNYATDFQIKTTLVWKHTVYDFNSLLNYNTVYFSKCSRCSSETMLILVLIHKCGFILSIHQLKFLNHFNICENLLKFSSCFLYYWVMCWILLVT
jgi:hypothetical protein